MRGFLTGLALGFLGGVAVAPSSGTETRRSLRSKAGQARNSVRTQITDIREKFSPGWEAGRRDSVATEVLNTIDRSQLLQVQGMNPMLADRIIAGRPYKSIEQVVQRGWITTTAVAQFRKDLQATAARRRA